MEAALRTAYNMLTGTDLEKVEFEDVRGPKGIKEASVTINGAVYNLVAASGLANAKEVMKRLKEDPNRYHFIEIMACPGVA